jgi:hypothetical protein
LSFLRGPICEDQPRCGEILRPCPIAAPGSSASNAIIATQLARQDNPIRFAWAPLAEDFCPFWGRGGEFASWSLNRKANYRRMTLFYG